MERYTQKITNIETGEVLAYRMKRQHCARLDDDMGALQKMGKFEDAEEDGRLLILPCKTVYFIVDKNTKYATVMSKDIRNLSLFEIEGIDVNGYYFSTREKAESASNKTEVSP